MIRSWVIVIALVVLVIGVVVAKKAFVPSVGAHGNAPAPAPQKQKTGVPSKTFYGDKLTDSLESGKPTLADFGAGTCKQCIKQAPILDAAAEKFKGKANIVYVDVNMYEPFTRAYQVKLIPTQILFDKNGKEVSRHVGVHPLEAIEADLAKVGVTP